MFTAKSEEKLCEDCEAGDGGAGQGAAPDRTCVYTQRMITANGQANWIKGGETITEFTFTAAIGAVAGPRAWMRSSTRI